jgi:single-strand DNA-binding protein
MGANFNFNKVILGGRLTQDIELKVTQSGISVCTFDIAVNRKVAKDQPQKSDFITCQAWRQTAEFVHKYFNKGSSILLVGSLQNRKWTDARGVKHYATDVIADEVTFVDSRGESAAAQADQAGFVPPAYTAPAEAPKFEEIKQDDDLPF